MNQNVIYIMCGVLPCAETNANIENNTSICVCMVASAGEVTVLSCVRRGIYTQPSQGRLPSSEILNKKKVSF